MHIPQDELQKFQDGTMNTDEMIHFLEHMEQCDFCLDELLQNEDAASEYAPSYLQDEILKKATYIQTEQVILHRKQKLRFLHPLTLVPA